jgi:hypothetical protein
LIKVPIARFLDAGLTIAAVALVAYAAMAAYLFFAQASFIYFPEQPSRRLTADPGYVGLGFEEVWLHTDDDLRLNAWFIPAESSKAVLFFHGNAGNISHRLDSIRLFHELGLNVLIFDYRGYGLSEGSPNEQGTYRDARAAWRWLVEDGGFEPSSIVLFGRSLGGAIAAWLAAHEQPGALIVESAFSSVPEMGRRLYPWLPVGWLSRFDYPTAQHVAQASCPVLVTHSRQDDIIPFQQGEAIYAAASEPKVFLELQGGHNDGFLVSTGYVAGLQEFLRRYFGPDRVR